ncbi:MAG: hypothetical protein AB1801_00135 [Chloroflexota bacterium]
MSFTDFSSILSIYGNVQAVDYRCPENGDTDQPCDCRFAVENDDGRFSVQATLSPQDCDQLQNARVRVVGSLHSTFFRQCRQHHQFVAAFTIVILNPTKMGHDNVVTVLQSESAAGLGLDP